MKLFIAIPSNRGWSAWFGDSFSRLVKRLALEGVDFEIDCLLNSSCLPRARSGSVKLARENNATHLLFLDDDMAFPNIIFTSMIGKKKPVVIANYPTKQSWDQKPTCIGLDGKRISSEGKTYIEQVKAGGLGIALIELSSLPEEPLFSMPWNGNDYLGEDVFFFMRLEEEGIPVYVDHDISNMIAHVGEYGYHFECKK